MLKRVGQRRFAVLKLAAQGHGLAEAVGQTGELEIWQGEGRRYGVSFFWPAVVPGSGRPPISREFFQESQRYFHSELIYELVEDGKAMKFVHDGRDCLVFEFLEEGSRE